MAIDYAGATIEWGTTPDTITLLELTKQLMGITDNTQDAEISMYLDMAGRACELFCDNKLVAQDVTEEFAISHAPIALRYWTAGDLASVIVDSVDVTADYTLYLSQGIAWCAKSTTGSTNAGKFEQMSIGYTAGYAPLPSELGYAIATVAISYEQSGGSSVGSVRKEVINGVGSIEYVTATDVDGNIGQLSPTVLGVLEGYRRIHA